MTTVSEIFYLIRQVNCVIDSGQKSRVSMEKMRGILENEELFDFLKVVKGIDLSLLKDSDYEYFNRNLKDLASVYKGRERRKTGIEKKGLCLLLVYLIELAERSTHYKCGIVEAWDVGK